MLQLLAYQRPHDFRFFFVRSFEFSAIADPSSLGLPCGLWAAQRDVAGWPGLDGAATALLMLPALLLIRCRRQLP